MIIPFCLPHVFMPESNQEENADALCTLLAALVQLNEQYLRRRPATVSLYGSGVVYRRENTWDSIPGLLIRGYGDCKSLTAWRVAELRAAGIDAEPVFRWLYNPHRNRMEYHILVQTSEGFEDPSKKLGMGRNENG